MSVIMMNLFAGPPLFRAAVIAVGEARALQLPSQTGDVRMQSPRQASQHALPFWDANFRCPVFPVAEAILYVISKAFGACDLQESGQR